MSIDCSYEYQKKNPRTNRFRQLCNYLKVISKRILAMFAPEEAEIFKDYLFLSA
jgi:hypothetical protein